MLENCSISLHVFTIQSHNMALFLCVIVIIQTKRAFYLSRHKMSEWVRGSRNDCSVTCWVTAKISFSFDLHVCMSLVQSVSQSVTQCTLTSHYATEFTVNAYNLAGVTFVESVHNLCVPNVHTMTEEEKKKEKQK